MMVTTLRAGVVFTLVTIASLVVLVTQSLALKLHDGWARQVPMIYFRFVCWAMGTRITVLGTPVQGGVLMAANHTGWLDIPIISSLMPVSFIAKEEIKSWPFFGTFVQLQRTIFVRRERSKTLEASETIRRRLIDGDTLVIFAEGTSSDGNGVLPFKSSLLSASELTVGDGKDRKSVHAPVQPVSIAYVGLHGLPMGRENRPFFAWYGDMDLMPHIWEAFEAGPIDVVVELHKPLTIDELGGRKELAAAAEKAVRDGVARALAGAVTVVPSPQRDDELLEALEEDSEGEEAA